MRILLTNDDGIHAPGIEALYTALTDPTGELGGPLAEVVWPIAPLTVQSATSHGVTFHTPLMVSPETVSPAMSGVSVDGRPADCVKLAICSLWPERFGPGSKPDLVISGMNAGANVGINVIYSGTVAAALEAAFLGVPAIAVSLHIGRGKTRFDIGARHARRVLERIVRGGLGDSDDSWVKPHDCISINIPVCEDPVDPSTVPAGKIKPQWSSGDYGPPMAPAGADEALPLRVCPMNTHALIDSYERRTSPGGDVYYWAAGGGLDFRSADPGTDVQALFQRQITITPLRFDLTDHAKLGAWRRQLGV